MAVGGHEPPGMDEHPVVPLTDLCGLDMCEISTLLCMLMYAKTNFADFWAFSQQWPRMHGATREQLKDILTEVGGQVADACLHLDEHAQAVRDAN